MDSFEWNFITRRGHLLYDGDNIFRWASYNVPALLLLEDRPSKTLYGFPVCERPVPNPEIDENGYGYGMELGRSCILPKQDEQDPVNSTEWVIPTPEEQEDAILAVKGSGGRVIRTYTLGMGRMHHIQAPNSFYEPAFIAMDHALALARKHGIRLVIPLINNHNGGDSAGLGNFGDYLGLCLFRGIPPSQFYTDETMKADFRNIITFVLNRVNTINGIRYGDDPTILAWQLGNELGGWEGPAPPAAWTIEMATCIKQLAKNTLVMDGTMGGLDAPNRYPDKVLQSSVIDIFSNHYYYGSSDYPRIKRDAEFITKFSKAFIVGEFGFDYKNCKKIYEICVNDQRISGCMVWSLRYHSRDGGFYSHNEDKGFLSFHVPGFPEAEGFGCDDIRMAKMIRQMGWAMQGVDPSTVPAPLPAPCKPTYGAISPHNLRWFGSAWAEKYKIYRRRQNEWILIGEIIDNKRYGSSLFADTQAEPGQMYEYMIQPVDINGVPNIHTPLVLGPLLA
jgi:hypothetical protein